MIIVICGIDLGNKLLGLQYVETNEYTVKCAEPSGFCSKNKKEKKDLVVVFFLCS